MSETVTKVALLDPETSNIVAHGDIIEEVGNVITVKDNHNSKHYYFKTNTSRNKFTHINKLGHRMYPNLQIIDDFDSFVLSTN